ncbi:hypothetical protein K461DRAFT_276841 [Myriangium duriaei CBS 260.36]|uniref:Uncharacterized protein n=1 Tax=Myriangium duriaei CBS 260.36 TaxID=1168546 RepID=A0A9P4MGM7_9PEZI|nr:hypothetical protein K461DRAFT_276841 [Myriangium duriaei CBS 260.36]
MSMLGRAPVGLLSAYHMPLAHTSVCTSPAIWYDRQRDVDTSFSRILGSTPRRNRERIRKVLTTPLRCVLS